MLIFCLKQNSIFNLGMREVTKHEIFALAQDCISCMMYVSNTIAFYLSLLLLFHNQNSVQNLF